MTNVVDRGTGQSAKLSFAWSGKTGTAEEDKNKSPHSWFIAFGPNSSPQVAICVMVEHGGHGGATAAPIAAKWMDRWMNGRAHSTEKTSSPRVEVESASASPTN
ncbi:MAG: penicillin-binding transpeptidase domain-containing protein [Armatimonadota bacterium]